MQRTPGDSGDAFGFEIVVIRWVVLSSGCDVERSLGLNGWWTPPARGERRDGEGEGGGGLS